MKDTVLMLLMAAGAAGLPDAARAAEAGPDFAEGVRSTEPLPASEQLQAFQLPDGFRVTLFAEEPEIAKPMNMAFDSRGRLWVTSSLEYPYAAPADREARDTLRVLEDTNGDGRADKITTFADGLNIPIGVYPFNAGSSALVWSIPNIWRLDDTNGDGVADRREVLFGPIGEALDTHGMQNGFTRAFDGWIYVCHGFRNESVVRARDGSEVRLQSGNTYRFRLDGSRVEQYTWGQVNPFGMCLDPLGNHYTADCHSSPIYQLVRGGYYPSFGKPDDGLGFAPLLMQHAHGSTALCGVAYYSADSNWPEEFRDTLFVGNVMTSRVHRDQVVFRGASPGAVEKPDFLRSTDPWFRPVDIQMGPDGALYVADFYNRIIGHYEVPLTHPGRDRYRGRIWRITYEGGEPFRPFASLADASMQEVIDRLADRNLTARLLAMHELTDRYGADAAAPVQRAWNNSGSPEQRVAALWVLERLGRLEPADLAKAIASGTSREERVHALRIAGEIADLPREVDSAAVAALGDPDPFVRRQAGEMSGRHANARNIPLLIGALDSVPAGDDHLRYVLRRALRAHFLEPGAFAAFSQSMAADNAAAAAEVATLAASIQSAAAADHIVAFLGGGHAPAGGDPAPLLRHAARFVSPGNVESLIAQVRERFAGDAGTQVPLYKAVDAGLRERGEAQSESLRGWALELSLALLGTGDTGDWAAAAAGKGGIPWVLQKRLPRGAAAAVSVVSSLPEGGEALTGVLRSGTFAIPATLTVRLCGHDGYPDKPAKGVNFIVLREAANGAEIARVPAPRTDDIVERALDLGAYAGRDGYLEVVDGDSGDAYAWLGFAGAEPAVVSLPGSGQRDDAARLRDGVALAGQWHFSETLPVLAKLAEDSGHAGDLRAAALDALTGEIAATTARNLLGQAAAAPALAAAAVNALVTHGAGALDDDEAALGAAFARLPARLQREAATTLAARRGSLLLKLVASGAVGGQLLKDEGVQNALARSAPEGWEQQVAALTAALPSDLERLQKLAAERFQAFQASGRENASPGRGGEVFNSNCAICHQVGGQGKLVGPQLDGIGKRGVERMLEDIVNPNQNVDHAFRLSYVTRKDGETLAGLFRREEGETLVFADAGGNEIPVAKADVASREDSSLSLMPPVYGDALTPEQLFDLIAFLAQK